MSNNNQTNRPNDPNRVQADKRPGQGQGTGAPQKGSDMGKSGSYDKQGQKPGHPGLGQKGQPGSHDRNR